MYLCAVNNILAEIMPRQERLQSATGIYHVMLRGINKQDIFEDNEDYSQFLKWIMRTVPKFPLVDVQETEDGDGSLWDREADFISLRQAFIRNIGAFKRNAHRECKPSIGTHEHRHDTNLCEDNEPETQQ